MITKILWIFSHLLWYILTWADSLNQICTSTEPLAKLMTLKLRYNGIIIFVAPILISWYLRDKHYLFWRCKINHFTPHHERTLPTLPYGSIRPRSILGFSLIFFLGSLKSPAIAARLTLASAFPGVMAYGFKWSDDARRPTNTFWLVNKVSCYHIIDVKDVGAPCHP